MTRYILPGAPGAGKTVLLRGLERAGVRVVEEAATDVIAWRQAKGEAEPWTAADFCDDILALQQAREAAAPSDRTVVFDRSPVCTLALARFLGREPSARLLAAAERASERYDRRVLFVEGLDHIVHTEARRISLEEARRFGEVHREVYAACGFALVTVAAAPPEERIARVLALIEGA